MITRIPAVTFGVIALSAFGLLAPATAAAAVNLSSACSTIGATGSATFTIADDATRYGTLRAALGSGPGPFLDQPAMTVRVRDGSGRLVVSKRVTDGSLVIPFARKIGGPNWTAEASLDNTFGGPCVTGPVKIAIIG